MDGSYDDTQMNNEKVSSTAKLGTQVAISKTKMGLLKKDMV